MSKISCDGCLKKHEVEDTHISFKVAQYKRGRLGKRLWFCKVECLYKYYGKFEVNRLRI